MEDLGKLPHTPAKDLEVIIRNKETGEELLKRDLTHFEIKTQLYACINFCVNKVEEYVRGKEHTLTLRYYSQHDADKFEKARALYDKMERVI